MHNFSRILTILCKIRKVVILTHRNGDPDAICSALALKRLLTRLNPKLGVVVGSPEGINKASERLLGELGLAVEVDLEPSNADIVFIVDTNNLQQLGPLASIVENLDRPVVVIDHHYPHPSTKEFADVAFCDESYPSTCEIIYKFYTQLRIKPRRQDVKILLAGILYETGHLRLATSRTLLAVASLIRHGVKIEELYPLLRTEMDDSERIARIKAAQRSRMVRVGEWVVVFSRIGSHQATAARALTMLGADLAVVGCEDKNRLKLSLRSTKEFYQRSGIHLGRDLAKPLGDCLNGAGGGHSLAAGVNSLTGELEYALARCSDLLKELMRSSQACKHPQGSIAQERSV